MSMCPASSHDLTRFYHRLAAENAEWRARDCFELARLCDRDGLPTDAMEYRARASAYLSVVQLHGYGLAYAA